jgi:hypothetical protein
MNNDVFYFDSIRLGRFRRRVHNRAVAIAGDRLSAEYEALLDAVNEERKRMTVEMDILRAEIRELCSSIDTARCDLARTRAELKASHERFRKFVMIDEALAADGAGTRLQ